MNKKINRRRFLKEGFFWGLVAVLFPLLKMGGNDKSHQNLKPREASHWRRLAG